MFNDPEKLSALEAILHPPLFETIEKEYQRAAGNCFVVEMPLVQETGKVQAFDQIIAVSSCSETAERRFIEARLFPKKASKKRSKRQWSCKEKAAGADYVIYNDGTLEELTNEVLKVMKEILS